MPDSPSSPYPKAPVLFRSETFDLNYKLAYCRNTVRRAIQDLEAETETGRLMALAGLRAALAECERGDA